MLMQERGTEHVCPPQTLSISVSDGAKTALLNTMAKNNLEGMTLRVYVGTKGPSGVMFAMMLENIFHENDIYLETNGVKMVVDASSAEFLEDAKIDYIQDGEKGPGFLIQTPNKKHDDHGGCACGGVCGCQ